MSQNSEDIKKKVQEKSDKLAQLGSSLAKSQFSYKMEEKFQKNIGKKKLKI